MKPLELMKLWSDLQIILKDPSFTDEQKLKVGEEVLRGLPPTLMCVHSSFTREFVESLIRKELENYRGKQQTTEKTVEAEIRPTKREGSKQSPVRKSKPV